MKLSLTDHETREVIVDFTPEATVDVKNLYLAIYSKNNRTWAGEQAEIEINDFIQIVLLKLQHVIYGSINYKGKTSDAQVGFCISKHRNHFEPILLKYDSSHLNVTAGYTEATLLLHNPKIQLIDYQDYCDIKNIIGNKEVTFKQYIINKIFDMRVTDNPLDSFPMNDASLFNVTNKLEEEDFITTKGMSIFLEEKKKEFYAKD